METDGLPVAKFDHNSRTSRHDLWLREFHDLGLHWTMRLPVGRRGATT